MTEQDPLVAVVTGASRGAGLEIARALGALGATVYVTGRSGRKVGRTEDMPGTVEDAADAVTAAGGVGVPVLCDHTDDRDVAALFERVANERGHLDVLVNNVWGGYEDHAHSGFSKPFWERPARSWDGMFVAGVRAHLVASAHAAPLLFKSARGVIVNTVAWMEDRYLGNLYYDTAKAAIIRMAFGLAEELRACNIAALAVAPGFMRTERVMFEHAKAPFDLTGTESPVYVARGVAALANDPEVMRWTGRLVYAADLARAYDLTDEDGSQPPRFRAPVE